ncbi:hypothetical protein AB0F17_28615 [Nonomuraea sp. NPDC026600]|uniref:hypothetical protein n=1 Tax=Nonomuraea sp. NPDC026600 TaxID=3155363 RepID=UPI0033DDFDFB
MTDERKPQEEAPPAPTIPEQAPSAGSDPAALGASPDSPQVTDPCNRAVIVGALQSALANLGVHTKQYRPTRHDGSFGVLASGGGMTQMVALKADGKRPGRYAWYWLWADGLRGEGPITTERACDGEDISTACTRIARVLGVVPVAV